MNLEILFSVIVPSYNRAGLIKETIHSLLEQVYFHFELIIVDDGSTDETEMVVRPYLKDERIRYFKIKNSERGAARNFGTKNSNGDYITFLDSDDILLPRHLQTANQKVELANRPPVFHLGYEILHPDGKVDFNPQLPSPVNDKLLEGNFLSCMGVFLRRDIAMENLFDEDRQLAGSEDYELWMRIAARVPILTFPEITSRLINHDDRSVINVDPQRLVIRISMLEKRLEGNTAFTERFGKTAAIFSSYCSLYLALHLALCGERWLAFKNLMRTASQYPLAMTNYRFIVALKKIVLW